MSKYRRVDDPQKRVLSVRTMTRTDDDADLTHLGRWSDEPGRPECTIDVAARGDYWARIKGRVELRRAVADAAAGGVIGL